MSRSPWAALAPSGLHRRADTSSRAAALGLLGRFVDELLSGTFLALAPTLRRRFGLSLLAIGALEQALTWVAVLVEPPAALLVDLRSRRALLAGGAATIAAAVVVMGLAPAYGVLLAGFALYGVGSGPLAQTADVVVVESFPEEAERAVGRATLLDTTGALVAPLLVAAAAWSDVGWRVALLAVGGVAAAYAWAVWCTPFPSPTAAGSPDAPLAEAAANVRAVLADGGARRWLVVLVLVELLDAGAALSYVWLHEEVGLSQAGVGLYVAFELVVAAAALLWLDRALRHRPAGRVLAAACASVALLVPLWLAAPGVWGRVVVGAPLAFGEALLWPLARARALAAVPGRAGALTAVAALSGVLPLALGFAALAQAVGFPAALLGVHVPVVAALLVLSRSSGATGAT